MVAGMTRLDQVVRLIQSIRIMGERFKVESGDYLGRGLNPA